VPAYLYLCVSVTLQYSTAVRDPTTLIESLPGESVSTPIEAASCTEGQTLFETLFEVAIGKF